MSPREPDAFALRTLFPRSQNLFLRGLAPGPGFTVGSEAVDVWRFAEEVALRDCRREPEGACEVTRAVWTHPPTGLDIEAEYRSFGATGVVEISGRMTHRGGNVLRDLRGPFALFFKTAVPPRCTPRLTWVYGGAETEGCFPPSSYAVHHVDLPRLGGKTLFGGRLGGRSTETDMPYAIVTDPVRQQGFFCVLEWPCRWILSVQRTVDDLRVLAHVAYTNFDLAPGESVTLPRVLLGFFDGDVHAGSNALRRHIVRQVMRPVQGQPLLPPVCYNHYYGLDAGTWTVETLKREAEVYAELGVEYFVVDAGWFDEGFRRGIGNWEVADPKRFPNGMEEIVAYVEALGLKFGSWLEIEYAMPSSRWVKEHPDWYREATGRQNLFYGTRRFNECLLRLEDPEVRRAVADFIVCWVERYHIRWLRWDFNDAPAPFWEANEAETAVGRLQVGYGEGLLALLDEVMARCPHVHIEACAGGGHRMDLGTLRRAHSAWINDNSSTIEAIRAFKRGVNWVLPGCYANSAFLWATHAEQRLQSLASLQRDGYPPYVLRSQMAGTLLFAEQSHLFTPDIKAYLKREIANYKRIRRFLLEDYYPLFAPRTLEDYDGWQFHDPQTQEGFVLVFRCASPARRAEVVLRGLEEGRLYRAEDMDTGRAFRFRGAEKLSLHVSARQGTRWLCYGPA
jgi:alpha-galactosidase